MEDKQLTALLDMKIVPMVMAELDAKDLLTDVGFDCEAYIRDMMRRYVDKMIVAEERRILYGESPMVEPIGFLKYRGPIS